MPTVQKMPRAVSLQELPGARLTAAETPESQGAGIAEAQGQIGEALAGVGHKTAALGEEIVAREKQRADATAVLGADTGIGQWLTKRVYDPQTGALTVKGKDAQGLPEQIRDEFNQKADEIEATLSTREQKLAFRRIRAERGLTLDHVISEHALAESQQYEGQVVQASLVNSRNFAIASSDNPRQVGIELQRQRDAIAVHGAHLGWSPEQIKEQTDASVSATHVGIVEKLLADEKPKAAQVWFEEAKSQINGDQIGRLEKALKEGSTRKEGQIQADAIIAAGGTLTQQRDKAKQIDDADVRDQAMTRIEHEWSVREAQQRDDDEAASKAAFNILDQHRGDISKIPPTTWASFSGATKSALRSYGEHLAKGDPVETDWPTYYGLMSKAGTDPTTFATENLLGYRAKLGNGEFKQLTDLQLSIRNKDAAAADKQLAGFRTHEQIVNDSLGQYGIETEPSKQTPQQKTAVAELRRMLDVQVQAQEALTGKKATNQDIQSMTDKILSQQRGVQGSWWNLWPLSYVTGDGGRFFNTPNKRLIDFTVADVPASDRTQIEAALKKAGRPVSDQTVLDLYIQTQSRLAK